MLHCFVHLFGILTWNYMISETSSAVITVVLNMTICVLIQNVRFQRMTTSSWLMGWMRLSSTSLIMETPLLPSSQRSLPSSPLGSNWWSLSELIYWWGWRKILLRLKHSCMWYLTYSWNVAKQIIGNLNGWFSLTRNCEWPEKSVSLNGVIWSGWGVRNISFFILLKQNSVCGILIWDLNVIKN